jgi:hypothetical protein
MTTVAYRVELPHPPDVFVQQALNCLNEISLDPITNKANNFSIDYTQRNVQLSNGETHITRYQRKYTIPGWHEWCQQNIDPDCYHAGVAVNDGPSPYHGPHADAGRTWALYYMVETGGDHVTTSWWKHPDHPLVLKENLYPIVAWNYPELDLICSAQFQKYNWYLFNSRVLHSVENINHRRISLQTNVNMLPVSISKIDPIG